MVLEKYARETDLFLRVCGLLADGGYTPSEGGNLAWRLEKDLILITPTRTPKRDVTHQKLVFISARGDIVEGTERPTGEVPMYLRFFDQRPDIVSIIHCHPPAACAASLSETAGLLMRPLFPEAVIELGPVPLVPYAEPLTDDLAAAFDPYMQGYNHFLMKNHGILCMGTGDIYRTFLQAELLEATAGAALTAVRAGSVTELTQEDVRNLSRTMQVRDLSLPGAPGTNGSLENLYFTAAESAVSS